MQNYSILSMVSISETWNILKNKESLSEKFMGTVKPEAPLKHRLDFAQKKLQVQITKLGETEQKLKQKDEIFMQKIVEATKSDNNSYAKMYANELAEIRKHNKTVSNAKLSMEQVQIRLNTVSELGDVVVTLSPCMSMIKGLSTSLGGMMPEVAESMQDLSSMLGDIATGTQMTHDGTMGEFSASNKEAESILAEANAIAEGEFSKTMPEPPMSNSVEDILKEREAI